MKNKFWKILLLGTLSSCVNPYRANFNSTLDRLPLWTQSRLAPSSEKPRLVETDDIKTENVRQFEKGYVMIGYSKFDAPGQISDLALKEAKMVGADVVLVEKKFSKTLTEIASITNWPPNETTEIREEGRSTGGKEGDKTITRRTEITTSKGPETVYVPKQVDYFDHSATYWRKMDRPIFGALVQELSDEQKERLQSNRGLSVKAVMTGSPAYQTDLLKGDIITEINGKPVSGIANFYQDLSTFAGKKITLSVLRGKTTTTHQVTLAP